MFSCLRSLKFVVGMSSEASFVGGHKDPVDRVMVSVTVDKKYQLITKDETILKSFDFAVW